MSNLVGTGLNQVPTNGMLGGLAYQSPYSASIKDLDLRDLSKIKSEIADGAVDIFVYDTSKDSDGGAWRKRTQHTSWYNETLGTATRGSRKEFPAVAVIVAENSKVTIYDGDDPDMPMWMEFISTGGQYGAIYDGRTVISLVAKNGEIIVADSLDSVVRWNFIADTIKSESNSGRWNSNRNIADRNPSDSTNLWTNYDSGNTIVAYPLNDVAVTVLPNAPIDDATGLPVPTIAVATNGGVSVIKNDGTVASIDRGASAEFTGSIAFDEDNHIIISWGTSSGGFRHVSRIIDIDTSTSNGDGYTNDYFTAYTEGLGNSAGGDVNGVVTVDNTGRNFAVDYDNTTIRGENSDDRLVRVVPYNDTNTTAQNLVSFATTSYNTGWMHGEIKGAFLSDTDTTNVTAGSDLITNGSFATDSDWEKSSHWTISGGSATMPSTSSYYPLYTQANVFEIGKVYVVTVVVSAISGTIKLGSANTSNGGDIQSDEWQISSTGTYSALIKANGTDETRFGIARLETTTTSCTIDSVTIFEASELDRSVNGNALQVFGTITKSAVATGADLVAYSGWSSSNYLEQPYNSDLDFGSGDFSIMGWYYINSNTNYMPLVCRGTGSGSGTNWTIRTNTGTIIEWNGEGVIQSATGAVTGVWKQLCFVRTGGKGYLYIDGQLESQATIDATFPSEGTLRFGENSNEDQGYGAVEDFDGSLALWRISASAPSSEQIKKMYEDEKHLFEENAKCTLYGTSNLPTALAYDEDEETLYVGTSSGRSDFRGLRRINNTTTAVTTAISASNGLVAEQ